MFVLGIFFPCCKKKGAITGILAALATSWWLSLGSIVNPREADDLPTSTAGCADFNQTITAGSYDPPPIPSGIFRFYHISFVWIVTVGFTTHMAVSLLVSLVFERNEKEEVDPKYICPFVRRYMSNYVRKSTDNVLKESQPMMNGVSPTELNWLSPDDQ
ncbi:sodium-dependent multivitamin transporter-like [Dermacentor silvarum]|uniref:sodium-dependent multivitamin transporter-like n=1 Tax=Dermacentor silvarum TaxID=543639 RepID=UPI002101B7CC|nr:sodium-dependent multivitamin transporter-like [Dermacentor silvarum]